MQRHLPFGAVGSKSIRIESWPSELLTVQLYCPKSLNSGLFMRKMLRAKSKSGESCSIKVYDFSTRGLLSNLRRAARSTGYSSVIFSDCFAINLQDFPSIFQLFPII